MPNTTQNPYTPDMVPVETPDLADLELHKKSSDNKVSVITVISLFVFVVIILVEAFLLVRTNQLGPSEKPAFAGPSLQK